MPTKNIEKIAKDYNDAYKKITGRVVICGGRGCIAGGSLKVYEAFQQEVEKRKIGFCLQITKDCHENYLSLKIQQTVVEYSRLHPEKYVFTYQGDGDLASIGCGEIMHACNRGENIVVIFINNAIYGMTGGQMAPTTLLGQVTATTPYGRDAKLNGFPLKITELIAQLDGTCYVTRQTVHTPAAVRKAKAAIRKAFENTKKDKGTSFVEIVSTCNSGWKLDPIQANKWMVENMFPKYPLGDMKDI